MQSFHFCDSRGFLMIGLLLALLAAGCSRTKEQPVVGSIPDLRDTASEPVASKEKKMAEADLPVLENEDQNKALPVQANTQPTVVSTTNSNSMNKNTSGRSIAPLGSNGNLSAQETLDRARNGLHHAQRMATLGNHAKAFQETLSSWQELQRHLDNRLCRELADKLQLALKDYGESLNKRAISQDATSASRKPLTVE